MDTNVIGREHCGYFFTSLRQSSHPARSRIFVRDLTPASSGNGTGIGMADFTTARFVKALNLPIYLHECAYLAWHARRENSHSLRQ